MAIAIVDFDGTVCSLNLLFDSFPCHRWCLISPKATEGNTQKRLKTGPRRVGIKTASVSAMSETALGYHSPDCPVSTLTNAVQSCLQVSSPKIIGRALSFAKVCLSHLKPGAHRHIPRAHALTVTLLDIP